MTSTPRIPANTPTISSTCSQESSHDVAQWTASNGEEMQARLEAARQKHRLALIAQAQKHLFVDEIYTEQRATDGRLLWIAWAGHPSYDQAPLRANWPTELGAIRALRNQWRPMTTHRVETEPTVTDPPPMPSANLIDALSKYAPRPVRTGLRSLAAIAQVMIVILASFFLLLEILASRTSRSGRMSMHGSHATTDHNTRAILPRVEDASADDSMSARETVPSIAHPSSNRERRGDAALPVRRVRRIGVAR